MLSIWSLNKYFETPTYNLEYNENRINGNNICLHVYPAICLKTDLESLELRKEEPFECAQESLPVKE